MQGTQRTTGFCYPENHLALTRLEAPTQLSSSLESSRPSVLHHENAGLSRASPTIRFRATRQHTNDVLLLMMLSPPAASSAITPWLGTPRGAPAAPAPAAAAAAAASRRRRATASALDTSATNAAAAACSWNSRPRYWQDRSTPRSLPGTSRAASDTGVIGGRTRTIVFSTVMRQLLHTARHSAPPCTTTCASEGGAPSRLSTNSNTTLRMSTSSAITLAVAVLLVHLR
ncbi:unnamed protein product [Ectocarpus sp. 12 AP-2014]